MKIKLYNFFLGAPLSAWNNFWFTPKDDNLKSMALFRILFCATMLFFYITRAQDVSLFYGEQGFMPSAYARGLEHFRYHYTFLWNASDGFLNTLHTFFIFSLLMATLGFLTKIFMPIVFILHIAFLSRNPSVMFGVDMIGTFFMLYLIFANSGAHYSVDAYLFKTKNFLMNKKANFCSHIFHRLMQVQLCIIYAYAGMEKLKGTRWWDGSAVWDITTIGNMQRWDMSFVAHFPVLLAVSTYTVLFWETFFPVLVWKKELRNYFLFFGILLHIGIGLFMNLPSFAAMMMAIYALFLDGQEADQIVAWTKVEKFFNNSSKLV